MTEKKWTQIIVPSELHNELANLQEELKNIYGFNLAYWKVISHIIRFYKQNRKIESKESEND